MMQNLREKRARTSSIGGDDEKGGSHDAKRIRQDRGSSPEVEIGGAHGDEERSAHDAANASQKRTSSSEREVILASTSPGNHVQLPKAGGSKGYAKPSDIPPELAQYIMHLATKDEQREEDKGNKNFQSLMNTINKIQLTGKEGQRFVDRAFGKENIDAVNKSAADVRQMGDRFLEDGAIPERYMLDEEQRGGIVHAVSTVAATLWTRSAQEKTKIVASIKEIPFEPERLQAISQLSTYVDVLDDDDRSFVAAEGLKYLQDNTSDRGVTDNFYVASSILYFSEKYLNHEKKTELDGLLGSDPDLKIEYKCGGMLSIPQKKSYILSDKEEKQKLVERALDVLESEDFRSGCNNYNYRNLKYREEIFEMIHKNTSSMSAEQHAKKDRLATEAGIEMDKFDVKFDPKYLDDKSDKEEVAYNTDLFARSSKKLVYLNAPSNAWTAAKADQQQAALNVVEVSSSKVSATRSQIINRSISRGLAD